MKQFKSSVRIQIIWMIISNNLCKTIGFPDGSVVKNLPVMQVTQVWPLSQEDPLEKAMANHSSILVWRTPWTEEPGGLQSMGSQRVRHDSMHTHKDINRIGLGPLLMTSFCLHCLFKDSDGFMLIYGKNQYNIVKQLSSN